MKLILLLCLFIIISCGQQDGPEPEVLNADISDYQGFINSKSISQKDTTKDTYWLNSQYHKGQIKLYLYEDKKFFYSLDNLGTGKGDWFIDEGVLYLNSKYDWIPLNYEVFLGERSPNKYYMKFIDFRGSRVQEVQGLTK